MSLIQRFVLFLVLFTKVFFCAEIGNFGFDAANFDDFEDSDEEDQINFLNHPENNPIHLQGQAEIVQQADLVLPNFQLKGQVYDFNLPYSEEPLQFFCTLPEKFPVNLHLILHIFEFLFQASSDHQELC